MSVVIAKRTKNGFILGADSGCFRDQERSRAEKVFKLEYCDDVYVGGVGTLGEIQLVRYMENLIDPNAVKRNQLDIKSILTYTVPSLKKQLAKAQGLGSDKVFDKWDSEIIIVRHDKAFWIDSTFCVKEIDEFCAIGAPEDFCKGAYKVLLEHPYKKNTKGLYRYENIPDEKLVVELIKMTFDITIYTFYPILYINTATDKEFQIIRGGIVEFPPEQAESDSNDNR